MFLRKTLGPCGAFLALSLVATFSSMALAAKGSPTADSTTLVDFDYGGGCFTNEENYTPFGSTSAMISQDEHRARAGIDGMYCAAQINHGYGFVASHENGSRVTLAGEATGVHASIGMGHAGVFENTWMNVGTHLGGDVGLVAFGENSYCAAGVPAYSNINPTDKDIGALCRADQSNGVSVQGENLSTGAMGALGDGRYGVSGISSVGAAAHFTGSPAAQLEGDLYVNGAYRGSLGARGEGAPFPRPAFDSGWIYFSPGESKVLNPRIGGDVDAYRVEVLEKFRTGKYIRPSGRVYQNAPFGMAKMGSTWDLNTETEEITVTNIDNRKTGALGAKYMRVRIWYIM